MNWRRDELLSWRKFSLNSIPYRFLPWIGWWRRSLCSCRGRPNWNLWLKSWCRIPTWWRLRISECILRLASYEEWRTDWLVSLGIGRRSCRESPPGYRSAWSWYWYERNWGNAQSNTAPSLCDKCGLGWRHCTCLTYMDRKHRSLWNR